MNLAAQFGILAVAHAISFKEMVNRRQRVERAIGKKRRGIIDVAGHPRAEWGED
jgi:hypothetical protein